MAELGISNGDTGVVIATPEGPRAAMSNGRSYAPFVLEGIETMFAMTIHKSQGSQFDRVTVVLPGADSPLLTRELLYTAITRARRGVRIIGLREAIVTADARAPCVRVDRSATTHECPTPLRLATTREWPGAALPMRVFSPPGSAVSPGATS